MSSGESSPISPPGWMKVTLLLAAGYNLVWGTWVVLFPRRLFRPDWDGGAEPIRSSGSVSA